METLYRKVEIKSEQDLPKEDGLHFVHHKGDTIGALSWYNTEGQSEFWLTNIDWYLQPIEPQEPKEHTKTAEEILDKYSNYTTIGRVSCYAVEYTYAIKAMKEYAQNQQPEIILPFLEKGDVIKLYGDTTTVEGFDVQWNESLSEYEIILLTTGRGDPFERSLNDIELISNSNESEYKLKPLKMTVNEYYKLK